MKNTWITYSIAVLLTGSMIISCEPSSSRVENAREDLKEATTDLKEAKKELVMALKDSMQQYRKDSQEMLSQYEKNLIEFRAKIASEKRENTAEYNQKMAVLEHRNKELKKKLDDFQDEGKDKWESFKAEFNNDMDELGKAIKDLTVNNVK
jgi:predicted PolB exonuclease-like 3'-5' exonuclease